MDLVRNMDHDMEEGTELRAGDDSLDVAKGFDAFNAEVPEVVLGVVGGVLRDQGDEFTYNANEVDEALCLLVICLPLEVNTYGGFLGHARSAVTYPE